MVINLSQKVSNRELNHYGEVYIEQAVIESFLRLLTRQILPKLQEQLQTEVCQVVDTVDYTLPPFRFSQQYGLQYNASLIIMTPEELEEHGQARCESCDLDHVMDIDEECWNC